MAQSPANRNPDLDDFSLQGKLALVTGASSGIGEHLAGVLARAGASVALAARRLDKVEAAAKKLCAAGHRAVGIALDVTNLESHAQAFATIETALGGKPEILLNCAGILISKPFLEQTESEVRQIFDTNLLGSFFIAQRAARGMVERGGGSIINIASSAGIMGGQSLSSYAVTKAGIIQLTKVMALELARKHVRVNVVCPGNIETGVHQVFVDLGIVDSIKQRIPQRHLGQVSDLTGVTLLLASDAGRYMTGAIVSVDGGQVIS